MKDLTINISESEVEGIVWISSPQMKCFFAIDKKDIAKEIMKLQHEWEEICKTWAAQSDEWAQICEAWADQSNAKSLPK